VIVDLSGVTFIDSTALGVLVSGAKRVRPRNGNLDIVCTDENIIRIFEITGLDRIFGIFASRSEALSSAST
jgi:anti-sigma B factor antagonist